MSDAAEFHRPVIAVTGSSGKTTTKEMTASILHQRFKTFKSRENGNDVWFTSQYVKQIEESDEAIVLEYGMLQAGQIAKHCQLIQPNIGMITNVGKAHIGNFEKRGGLAGVAAAKSELIHGMKQDGWLFINADDENSKLLSISGFQGEVITIGMKGSADYYAKDILYTEDGMSFKVFLNGEYILFTVPIYGVHHIYNALFAIAVTHRLGCSPLEMQAGLDTFCDNYSSYFRLNVHRLTNGMTFMYYTFDAKPCAVKAGLDVLTEVGKGVNIAVLGDMLSLGIYSKDEHLQLGEHAAKKNVNYLYTYGQEGKWIGEGALASGFSKEQWMHFESIEELQGKIIEKAQPQLSILLMGYMSIENKKEIEMTETVRYLLQNLPTIKLDPEKYTQPKKELAKDAPAISTDSKAPKTFFGSIQQWFPFPFFYNKEK
ncbi:UDP-N-acetylmuramoyl-tripeptide--D-alanyl-D-alanine ligase [Bacillus ectoiniformans]|uniref:UDP-N-acetylmuramoyl-tripeptide--D-alanyl-D- alanine ligase n=1 Tax=Bacillus ectoiniformans TaxID=1494429 RepID=UPI00195A972B|nr:UDP-N-acetylmuramoyl-tripeptide--D-alanyl-D-alanine ligase [Bacillus ectoiniformans]MBM7647424.1 UDP-N-acetylmuramoyl-tripeptide--D-alanyl-D-alanine ligase [Bacillus ectoiniformans]